MLTSPIMTTDLGRALRQARKLRGATLQGVADAVGVSYAAVQQWESGKTVPSLDNLTKGASGQAVQNMNIMLGFPETTGLEQVALFP